jgi:hypothetical protein
MSDDDDFLQWLTSQPLDEPVEIDGESVYLKVRQDGAELGAFLVHSYTPAQLQDGLRQGFNSATRYDAGLGKTADSSSLVLNLWLPDCTGWAGAAEALENLLNQLSEWRAVFVPPKVLQMDSQTTRNEQRLRMLFTGAK